MTTTFHPPIEAQPPKPRPPKARAIKATEQTLGQDPRHVAESLAEALKKMPGTLAEKPTTKPAVPEIRVQSSPPPPRVQVIGFLYSHLRSKALALQPGQWFYWNDAPKHWKHLRKDFKRRPNLEHIEIYESGDGQIVIAYRKDGEPINVVEVPRRPRGGNKA